MNKNFFILAFATLGFVAQVSYADVGAVLEKTKGKDAQAVITEITRSVGEGGVFGRDLEFDGFADEGKFAIFRGDFAKGQLVNGQYKGAYRLYLGDTRLTRNINGNTFAIRVLIDNTNTLPGSVVDRTESDEMILLFAKAAKDAGYTGKEIKMFGFNSSRRAGLDTDPIIFNRSTGASKLLHLIENLSDYSLRASAEGIDSVIGKNARVIFNPDDSSISIIGLH